MVLRNNEIIRERNNKQMNHQILKDFKTYFEPKIELQKDFLLCGCSNRISETTTITNRKGK